MGVMSYLRLLTGREGGMGVMSYLLVIDGEGREVWASCLNYGY